MTRVIRVRVSLSNSGKKGYRIRVGVRVRVSFRVSVGVPVVVNIPAAVVLLSTVRVHRCTRGGDCTRISGQILSNGCSECIRGGCCAACEFGG